MLENIISYIKNNKIVFILLIILIVYLLYTYFKKDEINTEIEKTVIQESFISSDKFVGRKDGYVFKNDRQGLGYYIDKIEQ